MVGFFFSFNVSQLKTFLVLKYKKIQWKCLRWNELISNWVGLDCNRPTLIPKTARKLKQNREIIYFQAEESCWVNEREPEGLRLQKGRILEREGWLLQPLHPGVSCWFWAWARGGWSQGSHPGKTRSAELGDRSAELWQEIWEVPSEHLLNSGDARV